MRSSSVSSEVFL